MQLILQQEGIHQISAVMGFSNLTVNLILQKQKASFLGVDIVHVAEEEIMQHMTVNKAYRHNDHLLDILECNYNYSCIFAKHSYTVLVKFCVCVRVCVSVCARVCIFA